MPENLSAEAKQQRGRSNWMGLLLVVLLSPVLLLFVLVVVVARVVGALALHLLTLIVWLPVGRRVLFVYSDSPVWKVHIETEVLPRLPATASVLNWSERSRWSHWSLSVWLFRFYAGTKEYNPLGIVASPFSGPEVFRFWRAFREAKHGKHESLRALEASFFNAIGPADIGPARVMTREETKHRKTAIRSEATRVRQMLNEWAPLPGSPADEFDCVVDGVVSALHRGVTAPELADWICQEFDSHLGVPVARDEALGVASRILSWWSNPQSRNQRA